MDDIIIPHQNIYHSITTIFCPGNGCTKHQATKYVGNDYVYIKINDKIVDIVYIPTNNLQFLYNIFISNDFNDIGYGSSYNPIHYLSKSLHWTMNYFYNIKGVTHLPHSYLTEFNIGGKQDVENYLSEIRDCLNKTKSIQESDIVLFGTSRGASTVIIALTHLNQEEINRIKLVIVEAPFDTVPNVINSRYGSLLAPSVLYMLKNYAKYDDNQESPLSAVSSSKFPINLPLGFITSKVDNIVPCYHTMKLINILKSRGHNRIHHLELENSHHSNMTLNNENDIKSYYEFVHKLYNKYIIH